MVLVQRHKTPGKTNGASHGVSSLSVSPGLAISPVSNISMEHLSHWKKGQWNIPMVTLKVAFVTILLSWLVGIVAIFKARASLQELRYVYQIKQMDHNAALQTLKDAENSRRSIQKQVNTDRHTNQVLKHEVRVMSELDETLTRSQRRLEQKKGMAQHDVLVEWLEERHKALEKKIDGLTEFIQEESRREVLKKYGPGPYRVKFSVQLGNDDDHQSVVIKMAPLDKMPHAINTFLDMVSKGLWNNCIFWHVEDVDHVLMASPVSHYSGDSRSHHFLAMGVDKLSFPEYSPTYPHKVMTVGFSGAGPAFYINMQDNIKLHGPGGQGHHDLPDDADPCFGKVVEGMDVVQRMHEFDGRMRNNGWSDKPMTRIVKGEIL